MANYSAYDQSEGESNWDDKLEGFKGAVETDMTDAEDNIATKASQADFTTLETEVHNARGSKGSVDARLDISLNEDGSLKSSTSPATWIDIPEACVRVDDNTFTITGVDYTDILKFGRALRLTVSGSYVYTRVKSSNFATNTTVNVLENVVAVSPTAANYASDMQESSAYLWANILQERGNTITGSSGDLPTEITYDSGHIVTISYDGDGLPDEVKYYDQDGVTFLFKFTYSFSAGVYQSRTISWVE